MGQNRVRGKMYALFYEQIGLLLMLFAFLIGFLFDWQFGWQLGVTLAIFCVGYVISLRREWAKDKKHALVSRVGFLLLMFGALLGIRYDWRFGIPLIIFGASVIAFWDT